MDWVVARGTKRRYLEKVPREVDRFEKDLGSGALKVEARDNSGADCISQRQPELHLPSTHSFFFF